MFWKKRIQLDAYCHGTLSHIFSSHYDDVADTLLARGPATFKDAVDRDWYLANLHAACIQLLGVALARNLQRDQRSDALLQVSAFLESGAHTEVEGLRRQYNQAFGSDPEDGVRAMASLFAQACGASEADRGDVQRLHHDAFFEVLNALFKNIKSVRVVVSV